MQPFAKVVCTMTDDTGLTWLLALAGLAWVAGGTLQWLTLRKQERLIQELQLQSKTLQLLALAAEDNPRARDPAVPSFERPDEVRGSIRISDCRSF